MRKCLEWTDGRKEERKTTCFNNRHWWTSIEIQRWQKFLFYFSALTGSIVDDDDMWLVDSGASRHMPRDRGNLTSMLERRLSQRVELGDNHNYVVKWIGKTSIELEIGNNVLYVPSLKKNLVSISCLEDKGDRVVFVDGKGLVWPKASSIDDARVIEIHEGRLYRLLGQLAQALAHVEINPWELWHRRYAHLHYRALPALSQMVSSVLELQIEHEGVCKGLHLERMSKGHFSAVIVHRKKFWVWFTLMYVVQCQQNHLEVLYTKQLLLMTSLVRGGYISRIPRIKSSPSFKNSRLK